MHSFSIQFSGPCAVRDWFLQVEYFLKEHFDALGLGAHKEFIHFALTSQDVNNVAQPLMLRDAIQQSYLPTLRKFIKEVRKTKRKRKRVTRFSFSFVLAGERQSSCLRTHAYAFCSHRKYVPSMKHSPFHFTAFFWCACFAQCYCFCFDCCFCFGACVSC